jgi:putative ABC transport system permease protein
VGLAGIKALVTDLENLAHLNLDLIAIAIAASLASTLFAGLYPAWRTCQIAPAKYLKSQ